ncbi:MAG: OsmC family protein [Desulfobacterales bacterium]
MKHVMVKGLFLLLTLHLTIGTALSETAKEADEKKADTVYKVRVEVKEVKNRRVAGKVRNHTIYIDQPEEFGADNTAPTPPETLAFALGSCFVSTGRLIALQRNMSLREIEAVVESELDFAKALGTGQEKRAGFEGFKIIAKIDADMSLADKKKFIEEIASRCPMCDNILNPTPVSYELKE